MTTLEQSPEVKAAYGFLTETIKRATASQDPRINLMTGLVTDMVKKEVEEMLAKPNPTPATITLSAPAPIPVPDPTPVPESTMVGKTIYTVVSDTDESGVSLYSYESDENAKQKFTATVRTILFKLPEWTVDIEDSWKDASFDKKIEIIKSLADVTQYEDWIHVDSTDDEDSWYVFMSHDKIR